MHEHKHKHMKWWEVKAHEIIFGEEFKNAITAAEVSRDEHGIHYDHTHEHWVRAKQSQKGKPLPNFRKRYNEYHRLSPLTPGQVAERRAVAGRKLWAELHAKRNADQQWFESWLKRVPCGECRTGAKAILEQLPPVFGDGWFEWTVNFHNKVNEKLGKPQFTLDEARALWMK